MIGDFIKNKGLLAIAVVAIVVIAAVGVYFVVKDDDNSAPSEMHDSAGNEIVIPDNVVSITAASPSIADILCYMGYVDLIVCVSTSCSNPLLPGDLPTCGSYSRPDTDAISAANATITFMDGSNDNAVTAYQTLRAAGMNVVLLYGAQDTTEGVYSNVEIIGYVMNDWSQSESINNELKDIASTLSEMTKDSSTRNIMVTTSLGNLAINADGSFVDVNAVTASGSNVYMAGASSSIVSYASSVANVTSPSSGSGWSVADSDWLSTSTGDVDLLIVLWTNKAAMPTDAAVEELLEALRSTSSWGNCGAVQSGNIIFIGGNVGSDLSRATPYTIENGFPILSLFISPECYSMTSGGASLTLSDLPYCIYDDNVDELIGYTKNAPA